MAAYEDSSPEIIPEGEKINTIPDEYIPEEIQQEMAVPEQPQVNPLEQMGVDPAQVQGAIQNVQTGLPGAIENLQTNVGAYLRGRSVEEEAAWRQEQRDKMAEASAQFEEQTRGDPVRELIATGITGTMNAWDSGVQFGNLVGDTAKVGLNQVLGRPTDPSQNPFDVENYENDNNWLDIPEHWKPENHTGWGKFATGLVEFGLLVRWTGGAGNLAKGSKAGKAVQSLPALRSANTAIAGNKYLSFIDKGAKIFSEGAVAELISSSSEAGNIINLAEQYIPQYTPDVIKALAVRPEDNKWIARLKTVTAGGGMNHVGHVIGAFGKGLWRYIDDIRLGKSVEEATENANQAYQLDLFESIEADEKAIIELGVDDRLRGRGASNQDARDYFDSKHLDEDDYAALIDPNTSDADKLALRQLADKIGESKGDSFDNVTQRSLQQPTETPTPAVNPELFNPGERVTIKAGKNAGKQHVLESVIDLENGGTGRSYTPIASETSIRTVAAGNRSFEEFVREVLGDISESSFKEFDNRLNQEQINKLIMEEARPMIELIETFRKGKPEGEIASQFEKMLRKPDRYRVYAEGVIDGKPWKVKTISPTQKSANLLVLNALARTISDVSMGAVSVSDKLPIQRQGEMLIDAMKVLFKENKKMGMMWGLDGKAQQPGFILPKTVKELAEKRMRVGDIEADQYFTELHKLMKADRWEELRDLMELNLLSDGHVRTQVQIHEFLKAKLKGGRMDDVHIKGKLRQVIQGTFFNSILGAPRTIRKAVFGTNTLAMMRPIQALVGTRLPWVQLDEKQGAVAAAQIYSMGRAWGESWKMAKRNWDLGVARKNQDYTQKFEVEQDLKQWKALQPHYFKNPGTKMIAGKPVQTHLAAYEWEDSLVDFNMSPWTRYSQNAMGAGDAFARTVIGRQRMAMKAALDAIEKNPNIDVKKLKTIVADTEENFRKEIFDKNQDGEWIVKEKAASLAGDEAAMTRGLQENFEGFESISRIPGMKIFFPLVRPGFNFLDVVFQHTPAMTFRDKYYDLVKRPKVTGEPVSQRLLDKYGLTANEVAQEVALIEGRIATGTGVIFMGALAAASGRITGSMPHDKELRDLWKLNNIQPNSFVFGDLEKNPIYVPFIDNMLMPEVFAPLLTMTANAFAYQDVLGEKTTDETFEKLRWMSASMIVDQSMLAGAGDLAALMDPYTGGGSKVEYILSRQARAQFPHSALMGQLGNVIDSTQKEANTLWELIIKRDAIAKSFLKPKYDVISKDRSGKKLVYGPENPLFKIFNFGSPVAIVPVDGDPIRLLLKEIRFNMPEAMSNIEGVDLNSNEMSELQRILATTGPNGEDLRKDLEYVMTGGGSKYFKESLQQYKDSGRKITDGYNLKDAHFYTTVKDVFTKHKRRAKNEMIMKPEYSDLARRLRIAIEKKEALKTNQVTPETIERIENMEKLRTYGTN